MNWSSSTIFSLTRKYLFIISSKIKKDRLKPLCSLNNNQLIDLHLKFMARFLFDENLDLKWITNHLTRIYLVDM